MVVVFSGGGTGGHLYPALAIASALKEVRPEVSPHFVGAERGIEAKVLPERGLEHTLVSVEGLRRGKLFANVSVLRLLAGSVRALVRRFRALKPEAVVLTGGYASAPAGLAGVILGLPVVLQEQNETPGLTTRLMARWARQIHVAYPEARAKLPENARGVVRVTGNPIRPPVPIGRVEARQTFDLPPDGRVILVVGGSQGSKALNELASDIVRTGLVREPDVLLWSTGPSHYDKLKAALDDVETDRVRLVPYIDDMPSALAAADLAISRAGAMTTSELLAWGVPAVLIPLPTSAEDHQSRNAAALATAGAAVHLAESETTAEGLWREVEALATAPGRLEEMKARALSRARPNAAHEIAEAIAELLPFGGAA